MKKSPPKGQKSRAARGATLYGKGKKRKKKRNNLSQEFKQPFHQMSDPEYANRVIKYLADSGIKVESYKERYILRRLRVRMGRLKLNSYKDYLDYIKNYSKELQEIQESLSINVTRFFRNRDTFEKIKRDILPKLAQEQKIIKIWSAGCAVGAEPYSLSMIASDVIPANSQFSIIATDVKDELLKVARLGLYSPPYLDEMSEVEKSRYFLLTETGDYKVKPHIKKRVQFQHHDLMKDEYPRNVDVIVCRNVLIYVDRHAQNNILNKFFESLNPEGILVLGRTETLFGDWRKSVDIVSTKHRIYQKKDSTIFKKIHYDPHPSKFHKSTINKSKNYLTNNERLRELRDFRRTFEERKKLWEERLEDSRRKRLLRQRMKKNSTKIDDISSHSTKSRKAHFRGKTPTEKELERVRKTGSLSDYRSLLKRSEVPTRISKIRKDLED